MRAHTAGYVDTHHKSGAVRPGSQTDKADTGRSLSADKFSPVTFFFFFVSCAFYFTDGVLSGGSSRWICTSRLWQECAETSPTRRSFSHEEWGFWWNAPPSSGPDGRALWVYPQRSNPQLGQGAGLCASGYRQREREQRSWIDAK